MAPPTSPTPLSPYERDGQEFGLVPKYVLRKKTTISNGSGDDDNHPMTSPSKATQNGNGGPAVIVTPTKSPITSNTFGGGNHQNNNNNNYNSPVMKDCQGELQYDEDISTPSPPQIHALLQETDALLARRWRVANLVDSPAYESDKRLLLAAEHYHPHKAANRIEDHWKAKLELFGNTNSERILLMEDLSKTEKTEVGVEDGYVQLLPTRDLAGRAVLFFLYDASLYAKQAKNFRKILFYMMASALEDDETVRRGITLVVWNPTPKPWFDPFWNAYTKIGAPYKIHKLHYCQKETNDMPYSVQERREKETDIRMHKGSLQECLHGLVVSYGIPSHFIPLAFDGQLDRKEHLKWIELRRRIESFPLPQQRSIVLVPAQDDVLLGKRKMSMNGNVVYHQMVASNIEAYHDASEEGKQKIRLEIWTAITTERRGRFLLQIENSQIWEKLELQPALHKITQAFDFLCAQYYAAKHGAEVSPTSKKSAHDDDIFFGWIFDKKQCFNLIHCKDVGPKACW